MRKKDIRKLIITSVVIAIILITIFAVNMLITKLFNAKTPTEETVTKLVHQILDVGKDEKPNVLFVEDPVKLQANPFFTKAKIGDYFLVYEESKIAVLYRPSIKKIINTSALK